MGEAKAAEKKRVHEEKERAEQAAKAEALRLEAEAKALEEKRFQEEKEKAEQIAKAEAAKAVEEARIAEEKRQAALKQEAEQKEAEEKRRQEEARKAEEEKAREEQLRQEGIAKLKIEEETRAKEAKEREETLKLEEAQKTVQAEAMVKNIDDNANKDDTVVTGIQNKRTTDLAEQADPVKKPEESQAVAEDQGGFFSYIRSASDMVSRSVIGEVVSGVTNE